MKKVSIIIPAYNAEDNIENLVKSLLSQSRNGYELNKIIVNSDKSSDRTISIIKSIRSKKIELLDSHIRRGFAGSVEYLLHRYKDDVTIILNDDVVIKDKKFIQKIVQEFAPKDVGLASLLLQPIQPMNFIQYAQYSAFKIYVQMRQKFPNKNNKYTCDGKVLVLSKNFAKQISFPKDKSKVGNLDTYIYLLCLEKKFRYIYIDSTKVWFLFAASLREYYKWASRGNADKWLLRSRFKKLIDNEFNAPKSYFILPTIKEFVLNPFGLSLIAVVGLLAKNRAKKMANSFNPLWDTVKSTKKFNNIYR